MKCHIDKLINYLNMGLSSHVVITGSLKEIEQFRIELNQQLESEGRTTREHLCTTEPIELNQSDHVDLLIVKGLENLPALHPNSYDIRTYLDIATYKGLRSVILCETEHYARHFNDHRAPFYQFCSHYPIGNE